MVTGEKSSVTQITSTLPQYLTVAEVAGFFRVSRMTIYRWIDAGKLTAIRPSSRVTRITRDSFEQLRDSSATTPPAPHVPGQTALALETGAGDPF